MGSRNSNGCLHAHVQSGVACRAAVWKQPGGPPAEAGTHAVRSIHAHSGVLLSLQPEGEPDTGCDVDEP